MKYQADIRTLVFVMLVVFLHVFQLPKAGILSVFVFVLLNYILLVISHNQIHNGVFRKPQYNRIFELVLSLLTLGSLANMFGVHTLNHHLHTDDEKDWFSSDLVRTWPRFSGLLVFPLLAFYQAILHRSEVFEDSRFRPLKRRKQVEGFLLLILLVVIAYFSWEEAIYCWVIPGFFAKYALAITNLMQHQGCEPENDFFASRNFLGKSLNWLLFNNGYHTAHHLKPSMHWSRLPHYHWTQLDTKIPASLKEQSLLGFILFSYLPGRIKPLRNGS